MFFTLHKEDLNEVVTAKKGDRIVVALEEHPNVDTKWTWVHTPALTLVDESKKEETRDLELRVFRFAINASVTDVTFTLENPYINDVAVQTFKFSIVLK